MKIPFENQLKETEIAINASLKAGKAILEIYQNGTTLSNNNKQDLKTNADLLSNEILNKELEPSNHIILSEESLDNKERLDKKRIWIIDPLDGTNDFVKKTGEFSIMVALIEDHHPILSVIYQPTNNLLYLAKKGKGAYLLNNEKWLKLSTNTKEKLSDCTVVTSRSHLAKNESDFIKILNIKDSYKKGSAGLKAGDICRKKADIYFTTTNKIKHWDTCAAYLLIKESGGEITDMFGNDLIYNTEKVNHEHGILLATKLIHNELVNKYKQYATE